MYIEFGKTLANLLFVRVLCTMCQSAKNSLCKLKLYGNVMLAERRGVTQKFNFCYAI